MFDTMNEALKFRNGYADTYILGKVVNNKDDDTAASGSGINKDRIQVSAPGLYDPDEGEVPWVGPMKFSPFGIGKDWGVYGSPQPGSDVILELQGGNANYAIYHSIQRYPSPSEFSKPGKEWGFKDPRGNILHVDLENDEIYFKTRSGVEFHVSGSGGLTVISKDEAKLKAPKFVVEADIEHYGTLKSNGVNVGSDHTHDVIAEGSPTAGPQ
jgi:hypothetical protein